MNATDLRTCPSHGLFAGQNCHRCMDAARQLAQRAAGAHQDAPAPRAAPVPHHPDPLKQLASEKLAKGAPRQARTKKHENHTDTRLPNPKPTKQAGALDGDHAGKTSSPGCPLVRFTLCRIRLLDVDSKYGSVKDLLDGLQYAGLIRGDREGEINLEVHQIKVAHRHEEKTLIEITP